MASRFGFSVLALLVLTVALSVLYLGADGSDATEGDYGNFHWVMDDGKNLTVTGHGDLVSLLPEWVGCVTLTLMVDEGTVRFGPYLFYNEGSYPITTVTVNGPVGIIGDHAFHCQEYLTTVTVNGPVDTIRYNAFGYCDLLTSVTVNGSVGSIGEDAFCDCGSLTTVTVNGSVGSIGDEAFQYCTSLSEMTIAGPITNVSGSSFSHCDNLKTVNIACNDTEITAGSSAKGGIAKNADTVNHVHWYSATYGWADDGSSCTVHIACANTSDHNHDENANVASSVKVQPTAIVPGTTEYSVSGTYDGFAYADTKDLQDIHPITEGTQGDFRWTMNGTALTVTGQGTLEWDSLWVGLTDLTIVSDGSEVSVANHAFNYCESLKTVTVNGPVGSIGDGAFYGSSLTAVTINGLAGTISALAFHQCDSLTDVSIDGPVDIIGEDAFSDCDLLVTVTINGSVGTVLNHAFEFCGSLTTMTINGLVDSIGDYAFHVAGSLSELTISGPISSIGDGAFYECNGLKTVNVACNDPRNITAGSDGNGCIALYAETVNHVHRYSAAYEWADDGSSCIVHIVCANTSYHNHDENAAVTSSVKVQPTKTEMGITEYTVSGTYDGFEYYDTKEVQDIPAEGKGNTAIYIAVAAVAVLAVAGGAFLFIRSRR